MDLIHIYHVIFKIMNKLLNLKNKISTLKIFSSYIKLEILTYLID